MLVAVAFIPVSDLRGFTAWLSWFLAKALPGLLPVPAAMAFSDVMLLLGGVAEVPLLAGVSLLISGFGWLRR